MIHGQPAEIKAELERCGLLLLSDAALPSVAGLVAGERIGGSWWGHPRAQEIYQAANGLADSPDVIVTKLIAGKVTYVHRRLWPALVAMATSDQLWQTRGLGAAALTLLIVKGHCIKAPIVLSL